MESRNIYGDIVVTEKVPDRINTDDQVSRDYPEQLVITFDSMDSPKIAHVITQIRQYILTCTKHNEIPDIILNFCIALVDVRSENASELFVQNYITLAEYLYDLQAAQSNVKFTIMVRGTFLKCFIPLLYINIPVYVSKFTIIEPYDGCKYYHKGLIEYFISAIGHNIPSPFKLTGDDMVKLGLIIKK